ncbi:MAG TPA: DUF3015 family protein [Myxococcota bacterium]|nr:DUF3015 family protein [Myxococcota bacterium]
MARFALVALLVLAPVAAMADPDIGCGPGTQIWAGNSGVAPKVLGATTNGTFGLQTFGITFGTLGCHQGGKVVADARVREFAAANLDALAHDMAQGDGEVLSTFAGLIGVKDSDRAAFYAFTQRNFARIFATDDTTELQVLASLEKLMADEPQLAVYASQG